jgi:hypothetical protein
MNPTLRDIHLPEAVSWWPPAPGWWLLTLLAVAVGFALWRIWQTRSRRRLLHAAQQQLAQIENSYAETNDRGRALQNISMLLRRLALSRHPRAQVAGLTGERWLQFLDENLPDQPFTQGTGRILIDAPYKPAADVDMHALFSLCRNWISAQFKKRANTTSREAAKTRRGAL